MLEDYEYDDDNNIQDPILIVKHQKYKTWLYVILLIICFYILFYINLIKTESITVIKSDITFDLYNTLYVEHHETLSCPCSTITIPYQNFTSNNATTHSICSSIFIESQWINALYFKEAGHYGVWDFRTTAYSQFEILSKFCLLSKEILFQIQNDINKNELVSLYLLSQKQVEIEINGTIEYLKNSATFRMITFLNYLRNTSDKYYFITALNTNLIIMSICKLNEYSYSYFRAKQVGRIETGLEGQQCGNGIQIIHATLNPLPYDLIDNFDRHIMSPMSNSTIVNGFFTGCTPLEAILASTLDCLYEVECLRLLLNYFPNLIKINFNPNNSILSSKNERISVNQYLNNLFITNWSQEINYPKYFQQCSPTSCSYSKIERTQFIYAMTLFISLYGGLTIILRLIVSFSIDIIVKRKCYLKKRNENSTEQRIHPFKFVQTIKKFNLFKDKNDRTEQSIKHQKLITRVYFILLIGSICTVCIFTSLKSETITIIITNVSMTTYHSLQISYSSTLRCPCSNKAISYKNFLLLSPRLHQICSSSFIHNNWINILRSMDILYFANDWHLNPSLPFQFLSSFCYLARQTIDDAMNGYLSQLFIVSSVINETEFNKQINTSLNQFYQSTVYNFDSMADVLQLLIQIDQLYVELFRYYSDGNYQDVKLISDIMTNNRSKTQPVKLHFLLNEIQGINSSMNKCICALNPYCQTTYVTDYNGRPLIIDIDKNWFHNIPGWIRTCAAIDSVLFTSFECLYKDSECFPFLLAAIYEISINFDPSLSFDFDPMIYDSIMTRFSRNTNISIIFKEMMIEQWNPSISYQSFYESCAPIYCTYSQKMRTQNFLGVIITLISMVGGIIFSLRIITPYLVELILRLLTMLKHRQQRREQVHQNCFNRTKKIIQNVIKLAATKLIQLNIFSSLDFKSHFNQLKVKHYGQWATRLYIILFLSSFIILFFYTIIRPHSVTKTFNQPSFDSYQQLQRTYGNELKCLCSQIASTYNESVEITPIFHPICLSQFISKEWHMDIIDGLTSDFSLYLQNDYRRFLSAHLQYLQELCKISKDSVNNAINEFLTSLLVTIELLPQHDFYHRIETLIEQSKSNVPTIFSRFLFMIQIFNHGNAFMTTYGTNYQYASVMIKCDFDNYAYTEAMIYDDNCSCGLSSNCTAQASFIENSTTILIPGFKMGCLPSESFRLSTLECFYNQTCLELLHQYTNNQHSSIPLLNISIHFPPNTTINQLISHAFTEQWSRKIDYSLHYDQCLPSLCSYTYIEKFNILYIITLFLSLQGGLTLVLKWICPRLIRILIKIYHYYRRKRQRTILIHPDNSLTMSSNNINIQNIDRRTSEQIVISPIQRYSKIILIIISIIFLIMIVVIFSIYYARNVMNRTIDRYSNTITSSIISTTTESFCQDKFQQITTNISCLERNMKQFYIKTGEFNNDNQIDLVYSCTSNGNEQIIASLSNKNGTFSNSIIFILPNYYWIVFIYVADLDNNNRSDIILIHRCELKSKLTILLNNNDRTFQHSTILSFEHFSTVQGITSIDVADFNNDKQLDILLVQRFQSDVRFLILLGYGNGKFQTQNILSSIPFKDIITYLSINDFNNDKILDIILGIGMYRNFGVMYGLGNGSFTAYFFFKETKIAVSDIAIGNVNNDDYLDIIISEVFTRHIYVFSGTENQTFQILKPFFSTIGSMNHILMINDFDNDNQSDIAFLYKWKDIFCIVHHYHNNSFKRNEKTIVKTSGTINSVTARDINNDNYLDIILGMTQPDDIYVLYGYGNGYFYPQKIYSGEMLKTDSWLTVTDFNNDNYQDIIIVSGETMLINIFLYKYEYCTNLEN